MKTNYKVNNKLKIFCLSPVNHLIIVVKREPLNIFSKVTFKLSKSNTNSQFTNENKWSSR